MMNINKINPLYILAVVFLVMLISFVEVGKQELNLKEHKKEFDKFQVTSLTYNDLQQNISQKAIEEFIATLSSNELLKSANLTVEDSSSSVKFSIQTKNFPASQKLINDILNSHFNILTLELLEYKTVIEISKK